MLKKRVIPILTFNGIALVKTKKFSNPRMVGNPIQSARVFNSRNVDELIFVDLKASSLNRNINLDMAKFVINECFMPVAIGGGIRTNEDINSLLKIGADKVVIKTSALSNPNFIKSAVSNFGAQAIVIAVDIKRVNNDYVIHHFDQKLGGGDAIDFIKKVEDLGAGELCVTDVDNDGVMEGFNLDLFAQVLENSKLPIIAVGGAGKPEDFSDLLKSQPSITGLGASSIFYYTQFTPFDIKSKIFEEGFPSRIFDQHLIAARNT